MTDQRTLKNIIIGQREIIKIQSTQIENACKILIPLCKECSEDNFGDCQNDCKIKDLKMCLVTETIGAKKE